MEAATDRIEDDAPPLSYQSQLGEWGAVMSNIIHARYPREAAEQTEIVRKIVQGDARLCKKSNFGLMWKSIYPQKAAEHLALATGQSLRGCAYQLSGEQEVSTKSLTALILEAQKQ